jgi:N6-adenosine-specific RNA methylase IME4
LEVLKVKMTTVAAKEEEIAIIISDKYKNFVQPQSPAEFRAMMESIKKNGQLVKGVKNQNNVLIDGHHRYEACKKLGIPFKCETRYFENEIAELEYIHDVNDKRRHYNEFQRAEQALKLKDELAKKARENKVLAGKGIALTNVGKSTMNVQEELAKSAGVSKGTLNKVEQIIRSPLFKEDEEFAQSCRIGVKSINLAHQMIKREEDRYKERPPLPEGKWSVLVADPPWQYRFSAKRGAAEYHYPTMDVEEIEGLKDEISTRAADNAVLFLWATGPLLPEAMAVMAAWGFEYQSQRIWVKVCANCFKNKLQCDHRIGTGYYFRNQHELLLFGKKGEGLGLPAEAFLSSTVFYAERKEHSAKPDAAYEDIERLYPGHKYIDLFGRGEPRNDKWTVWGFKATGEEEEGEEEQEVEGFPE